MGNTQELPSLENPIIKQEWEQFRETGLIGFVNMILHQFGWTIAMDIDPITNKALGAFPAKTIFRGFCEEDQNIIYGKLDETIIERAKEIIQQKLGTFEASIDTEK